MFETTSRTKITPGAHDHYRGRDSGRSAHSPRTIVSASMSRRHLRVGIFVRRSRFSVVSGRLLGFGARAAARLARRVTPNTMIARPDISATTTSGAVNSRSRKTIRPYVNDTTSWQMFSNGVHTDNCVAWCRCCFFVRGVGWGSWWAGRGSAHRTGRQSCRARWQPPGWWRASSSW